ncbi:mediator of RNA polymerase II transcription subunit 9 isoform X1 [Phlebotomus papatasi]|uniref:Mediator of RNA polymerase II transcription subunit 9 n=1 Tax=Phlebotomus papatasi TaxID=29031 RepID=A0A1B0GM91_PHLPP|nr:mediator of RNA polymerase II transcription subunit 9 isoform X1 [Phlebotomus papatasi]
MDQLSGDKKEQKNGTPLSVDEIEIEILPTIYAIIRSVEKDPIDKQRESQDCSLKSSKKVLELQKRLESVRNQIRQLPIDLNKEEQLQRLETLRNQLLLKQKLLTKYKNIQF